MSVARFAQVARVGTFPRMRAHVALEAALIVDHDAAQRARLRVVINLAMHVQDMSSEGALYLEAGATLCAYEGARLKVRAHVFAHGPFHFETPLAEVALVSSLQVREAVLTQAALVHAHPAAHLTQAPRYFQAFLVF